MAILSQFENKSVSKTKTLLKIINFCAPKNCKLPKIIVKNTKDPWRCDFTFKAYKQPFIIFRFGHYSYFPFYFKMNKNRVKKTGYYGEYFFPNKTAAMIFMIAHEICHWLQYQDDNKKFWLYHDVKKAETEADNYAFKKMDKFLQLKQAGINPLK